MNLNPCSSSATRVIDCTIYNGEINVLKLRMKELFDLVEVFIVCESTHTHSGVDKPLYFPIDKLQIEKKYLDKIQYLVQSDFNPEDGAWERIRKQENYFYESGAIDQLALSPNDYIICSDMDEIPETDALQFSIDNSWQHILFRPHWFNFSFNNYLGDWEHHSIRLIRFDNLNEGMAFHNNIREIDGNKFVSTSGWHLSYFMSPNKVLEKLKAYAHYNDDEDVEVQTKGVEYIKLRMREGGDLFENIESKPFHGNFPRGTDEFYFRLQGDG